MSEEVVIEFTNAFIFQQNESLVLKDVSLSIRKAEFSYLIGKTGSGKTSLLKTLYGALPLLEGKGRISDVDLHSLKEKEIPFLRRKIGIVFQDFQLLTDRSVRDNLAFVLGATGWKDERQIQLRITNVLERVSLAKKIDDFPHQLSGGEQQRIVVARALLNDPLIILADEPTGNLDPDVSDDIMKLLHDICDSGTAVFMATHDHRILNKFPGTIYECSDQLVTKTNVIT